MTRQTTHPRHRSHSGHRTTSQRGGIIFRLMSLLVLIVFCFFIYIVRHPLLRLAGGFWVVDETPKPSDAIVFLGDDNFHADRAAHAAELFKAGWAPRVIGSGRLLRPYAGIAELEEHDLESDGVPGAAVIKFPQKTRNTREECTAIGQFVAAHGWKKILLVTSNYHTRRARYICSRVFPAGDTLIVSAARDSDYDPDNWWRTREGIKLFSGEAVGIVVAMWELRHYEVHATAPASSIIDLLPH